MPAAWLLIKALQAALLALHQPQVAGTEMITYVPLCTYLGAAEPNVSHDWLKHLISDLGTHVRRQLLQQALRGRAGPPRDVYIN
jgi:hypothetical protein